MSIFMINKKHILTCLMTMAGLSSCHDQFLEEKVYDSLTPLNFYKNEADIKAAVTSVYNGAHAFDAWGRQIWMAAEYPGEAAWPNFSGEAWRTEMDQFTWTPNSTGFKQIWSGLYKMIDRANTAIEFIPKVPYANEQTKDQLEGETRYLRSLAYLTLVRFFDHVPYITEANKSDLYPSNANTDDMVWNLIIEDLKFAASKLPPKHTGANVGRATAGAAQALLAKAYLTRAGKPWNKSEYWALAATETKSIMENTAYGYGLLEDYNAVFNLANEHGKEYVFSIEMESTINLGKDYASLTGIRSGNQIRLDGWSALISEVPFINSMPNSDKRKNKTFVMSYPDVRGTGLIYTYPETIALPHFNKFINADDVNATGTADYATNMPIMRYADILLMHSEAENEANGPSVDAVKGINQVRARAGLELLKPETFSKESLRDAIIQERVWEFAAEGQAYFDLKRQNALEKRVKNANIQSKHYAFPVPQDELDVNPNLTQHPLYK
jgi:hypothetical protein